MKGNKAFMKTITAKCSLCGYEEQYELSSEEIYNLRRYKLYGRQIGKIQDLFPKIPAWIRSGAIDITSNGFCICPYC